MLVLLLCNQNICAKVLIASAIASDHYCCEVLSFPEVRIWCFGLPWRDFFKFGVKRWRIVSWIYIYIPDSTITHHLDNRCCFETGPSRFATGVVSRMPARLATMWQRNVALLFLNCLYYWPVSGKIIYYCENSIEYKLYRPLYMDIGTNKRAAHTILQPQSLRRCGCETGRFRFKTGRVAKREGTGPSEFTECVALTLPH